MTGTFSVLSVLQSDVVIRQHLHNSQWKACLFCFTGSGDSCPLAGSKNRLRTQTICSPEWPGGTHVQMGLCFWTLSFSFLCLMLQDGSCDLSWRGFFVAAPGSNSGDITNYIAGIMSFEMHKTDINKVYHNVDTQLYDEKKIRILWKWLLLWWCSSHRPWPTVLWENAHSICPTCLSF